MNGILLIDKPAGWTSFDVVAKVRGVLRTESRIQNSEFGILNSGRLKVGHTGTLDPFATGLLILVVGSYTKRAQEFSKLDKVYEAMLVLGKTSTTGDPEGEIIEKSPDRPSEAQIKAVLSGFKGLISQTPPIYSAIKVNGQRAYKMARAGKEVKLEPRQVTIYKITDVNYDYPKLSFSVSVSSGTYIRSLAQDIGEKLGTGAYLSALRRTSVGQYQLKDAIELDKLDFETLECCLMTGVAK